jgi:hypothetical protein
MLLEIFLFSDICVGLRYSISYFPNRANRLHKPILRIAFFLLAL